MDCDVQITDGTATTYKYINSPRFIRVYTNCLYKEQFIWNPNWLDISLLYDVLYLSTWRSHTNRGGNIV